MEENMKNGEEMLEEQEVSSEELVEETAEVPADEIDIQSEEADIQTEESEEGVEFFAENEQEADGEEPCTDCKKKTSVIKWCVGVLAAVLLVASIVLGTISHFSQLKEIEKLQQKVEDMELVMQYGIFGEEISVVADYVREQVKLTD